MAISVSKVCRPGCLIGPQECHPALLMTIAQTNSPWKRNPSGQGKNIKHVFERWEYIGSNRSLLGYLDNWFTSPISFTTKGYRLQYRTRTVATGDQVWILRGAKDFVVLRSHGTYFNFICTAIGSLRSSLNAFYSIESLLMDQQPVRVQIR
jgi:hypothetical protein